MKPSELRELIKSKGMTATQIASELDISIRMMRYYTSETDPRPIPKCVIMAINSLKPLDK